MKTYEYRITSWLSNLISSIRFDSVWIVRASSERGQVGYKERRRKGLVWAKQP